MKTSRINTLARLTGLAIAMASFVSVAGQLQGAELVFKGGAEKLMTPAPAPSASVVQPMACMNCKSEWVTRTENTSKGVIKPTVLVEKHLCNGCNTTIATVGKGKAAQDVATHKCTTGGTKGPACCSTKKGA